MLYGLIKVRDHRVWVEDHVRDADYEFEEIPGGVARFHKELLYGHEITWTTYCSLLIQYDELMASLTLYHIVVDCYICN